MGAGKVGEFVLNGSISSEKSAPGNKWGLQNQGTGWIATTTQCGVGGIVIKGLGMCFNLGRYQLRGTVLLATRSMPISTVPSHPLPQL